MDLQQKNSIVPGPRTILMKGNENRKLRPGFGTKIFLHLDQVKDLKLIYIFSVYFCIDKYYTYELIFIYSQFKTEFKIQLNEFFRPVLETTAVYSNKLTYKKQKR